MNTIEKAGIYIRVNGKLYVEYEEFIESQNRYSELQDQLIKLNGEYIKIVAAQVNRPVCKMVVMKGRKAI